MQVKTVLTTNNKKPNQLTLQFCFAFGRVRQFTIHRRYSDALQLQWQWIWQRYRHGSYTPLFRRPFGHLSVIFGIWHKVNVIFVSWKQHVSSKCIFVVRGVYKLPLNFWYEPGKENVHTRKLLCFPSIFFKFNLYIFTCCYRLREKFAWRIFTYLKIYQLIIFTRFKWSFNLKYFEQIVTKTRGWIKYFSDQNVIYRAFTNHWLLTT